MAFSPYIFLDEEGDGARQSPVAWLPVDVSPSFLAPKTPDFNPPTIELLEGTAGPRKLDSILTHPPLKGRHTSSYQISDLRLLQPPQSLPL